MHEVNITLNEGADPFVKIRGTEYAVSYDTLARTFAKSSSFDMGLYPRGLRYLCSKRHNPNSWLAIIEVPEHTREVAWDWRTESDMQKPNTEIVTLPAGLFFLQFHKSASGEFVLESNASFVYALTKRFSSLSQTLYRYPTPNIYVYDAHALNGDNKICWGSQPDSAFVFSALSQLEGFVNSFFAFNFNDDLVGCLRSLSDKDLKVLDTPKYFKLLAQKQQSDTFSWPDILAPSLTAQNRIDYFQGR